MKRILQRWFGGGGKRRGVRGERVRERRRDDRTAMISPAALPPAPAPIPGGDAGRTVVGPSPGPAPAPAPSAPPARAPSPPRRSGDAGATRYTDAIPSAAGRVVGVLVAVDGELAGEVYRLFDGETRLGRDRSCQAVLPSEWISREHALVMHQGGVFAIKPLNDKNPTFVNEERTEGSELSDGDLVRMGKTTLRFRAVH